jgi:hypothetical protein
MFQTRIVRPIDFIRSAGDVRALDFIRAEFFSGLKDSLDQSLGPAPALIHQIP